MFVQPIKTGCAIDAFPFVELRNFEKRDTICITQNWRCIKLFSTHIRAVRDLRNSYPEVAQIVKNRDHVIITNNGKSEAVLISFDEFEKYQEFLQIRYVKEKLAEAEALADNPDEWIDVDDLFKEWDAWDAVVV